MKDSILSLVLISIFLSCSTSKKLAKEVVQPFETDSMAIGEIRDLDTMVVTPDDAESEIETSEEPEPKHPYRTTYTRRWDLLHTSLKLHFDWEQEQVLGKAELKLVPLFYTTDSLVLDAKSFSIHSIQRGSQAVNYSYDGNTITVRLGKPFTRKDTLLLSIDYTAKPGENSGTGSAAITDDNGLYFIDPRNSDKSLPTQLWTQGETENNSRWFPTIDKPNERMTQDITLTVPDTMITLSNGLLKTSVQNTNGTRTDTWVMDQPHAPYLVMIAAGPWSRIKDTWKDIPLEYYVDKEYAAYAKEIFNHTPEMLEFFSNKLGIKYPWKKFSQIIVKKFVSGAMENTTAVVFGDFIQKTHRELIDDPNDYIVAHEMFHHWFGDYVTTESWSNLTLNEGFANYSEYLWYEYKYGKYEADRHREDELMGYLSSISYGESHNLIDFHYADKENMFDAHSYNKGGLVLHMLRHYIGDDAFFTALNKYLHRHAYKSVEVHDLRLAFEEVTGEDLNWFFNQWYLDDGHPLLAYTTEYNKDTKQVSIHLEQKQKKSYPTVFILPIDVDIHHTNGTIERHRIWMNERKQTSTLPSNENPSLIVVDPNRVLLTEWEEPELSTAAYNLQWKKTNTLPLKLNALSALTEDKTYGTVWKEAIQHPHWYIRLRALDYLPTTGEADAKTLTSIALKDAHSQVRAAAIRSLSENNDKTNENLYESIIKSDSAFAPISEALKALSAINPQKAATLGKELEKENNTRLQEGIASAIAESGDPNDIDYFEKKLAESPQMAPALMDKYINLLMNQGLTTMYTKAAFLFNQAHRTDIDKNSKYFFVKGLYEIKDEFIHAALNQADSTKRKELESKALHLKSWIQEVKDKEKDPQTKDLLSHFN